MPEEKHLKSYLRRLPPEAYQGLAYVHWSMTIDGRKTGWLNPVFHGRFREILTHAAFTYGIACPVYCLMPDHFHMLWIGFRRDSDQRNAVRYIRKRLNSVLRPGGYDLQKQPHDNVLREEGRQRDAFQSVAWYIRANPARAGLVDGEEELSQYPHLGCLVPGYPELSIWEEDYWDRFWKLYWNLVGPEM